MSRIGDFKAQDTITKAMSGKGGNAENVVANNKAAILQETVQKAEVTNGKPANTSQPTQNQAETIFVASGASQSVHASGNRTKLPGSTNGLRHLNSNDRVNKELAKLLQGVNVVGTDDDTFEQLVHSAEPADKAIASLNNKNNKDFLVTKEFVAEKNKSVFIASGLIPQSNVKSKKTDSTDLDNLPNFSELLEGEKPNNKSSVVTYSSKGETKKAPIQGEQLNLCC